MNSAYHRQKKLAAVLLSILIAFAFTLSGCGEKSEESISADVSQGVAGVEYYHYDTSDFNDMCDELEELAAGDDADAVIDLYDKLYSECEKLETLYSVIYVMYSTDVTNDEYSKEQLYTFDAMQTCGDRLCEICRRITEGPCASAFAAHVGEEAFDSFAAYNVMTDEEKDLMNEEKKLVDDYYNILDDAEKATYSYGGKDWTMDQIAGEEGMELSATDYDGYMEIYDGLLKITNDKAGPIFLKLVQIRTRLAKIEGYDNYALYADREEYCRDYSEEEVNQLHKDVKKIGKKYFDSYYTSAFNDLTPLPKMSEADLMKNLQMCSDGISDLASASAQQMTSDKLISIGDESCRQDGAFTTYVQKTGKPFISMTLDGERDFIVLSHEFGHFVEYGNETRGNILTDMDNLDLAEVASNGFEGLATRFYKDIFKGKAEKAENAAIGELLENVIDGCAEDEFQREVYENPDMSLDEMNQRFSEIYAEYNPWMEGDPGYSWVFVSHNFESPMYYISYTVSALAALQIWNQSSTDFDKAAATWEKFIKEGTYNKTYLDVVDKCGLIKFTEKGAVNKICSPALEVIDSSVNMDFDYDFEN